MSGAMRGGKKRSSVASDGGRVTSETENKVSADRANMTVTGIIPKISSSSSPDGFGAIMSRQNRYSQLAAVASTAQITPAAVVLRQ